MRQLLRITTTFALGFFLTVGMAFGQGPAPEAGDDNEAIVEQEGNNAEVEITQTAVTSGTKNFADIDQDGAVNHIAKITQTTGNGDTGLGEDTGNDAYLDQNERGGARSRAFIVQGQSSPPSKSGQGNELRLEQTGNNLANVTQAKESTLEGYFGDRAIQRSVGGTALNEIDVSQTGNEEIVGVDQRGSGHYVEADQGAGNRHEAQLLQRGTNQLARVTQSTSRKFADVKQYGSDNEVAIAQGLQNVENVERSSAFVLQDGINNRTDVIQNGGDNLADVLQSGSNGEVTVNQTGTETTSP
jgi:hypothetical protein